MTTSSTGTGDATGVRNQPGKNVNTSAWNAILAAKHKISKRNEADHVPGRISRIEFVWNALFIAYRADFGLSGQRTQQGWALSAYRSHTTISRTNCAAGGHDILNAQ